MGTVTSDPGSDARFPAAAIAEAEMPIIFMAPPPLSLNIFERAIDARDLDAIWILNSAPMLRPLRLEPRYQALLARMGLPENLRR